MPHSMKPKQIEQELLKDVPAGFVGIHSVPRNRRLIQYELVKNRSHFVLAGDDSQNTLDMLHCLSHLVKDSCMKPLERYIFMSDDTRQMIFDIHMALQFEENSRNVSTKCPLLFHYDTTFNVGNNHVSILTLRDPTRERISKCANYSSHDAILPIAVMLHEGRLLEQHHAFFRAIDVQLLKGKKGDLSESRPFYLVTDNEFGNIWQSAKTIFCTNHLLRNLKEKISKTKAKECPHVNAVFYKLINSKTEESFLSTVNDLETGTINEGAIKEEGVRAYILKILVPKIQHFSGRLESLLFMCYTLVIQLFELFFKQILFL